jgi:hypothetical protein
MNPRPKRKARTGARNFWGMAPLASAKQECADCAQALPARNLPAENVVNLRCERFQ